MARWHSMCESIPETKCELINNYHFMCYSNITQEEGIEKAVEFIRENARFFTASEIEESLIVTQSGEYGKWAGWLVRFSNEMKELNYSLYRPS